MRPEKNLEGSTGSGGLTFRGCDFQRNVSVRADGCDSPRLFAVLFKIRVVCLRQRDRDSAF